MRWLTHNLLCWWLLTTHAIMAFLGYGLHGLYCSHATCANDGALCATATCASAACSHLHAASAPNPPSHHNHDDAGHEHTHSLQANAALAATVDLNDDQIACSQLTPPHDENCPICHLLALGQLSASYPVQTIIFDVTGAVHPTPAAPIWSDRYSTSLPRSPPQAV